MSKKLSWLIGITIVAVLTVLFVLFVFQDESTAPTDSSNTQIPIIDEPQSAETDIPPAIEPVFDQVSLQKEVDTWAGQLPAGTSASVVITDTEGVELASHNPDEIYFAASLYKLYVAYAGYQQLDDAVVDRDEAYVAGQTRAECLDKMIRESDSPCAEKLWTELGKQSLTSQLETYGIESTDMSAVTTTARDSATILARIARGEGLSKESRAAYLDSLKDQPQLYRRGLPSSFSDAVAVYNKVGWNLNKQWHDAAIIELEDGRQVVAAVLTENVGISRVANLAGIIEKEIVQ